MTVAYPMLFKEKILPMLNEHFGHENPKTYSKFGVLEALWVPAENHSLWVWKGRLVAISEGMDLGIGLVWIDDTRIPVDLSATIASMQHKAHNEMICRERQAAERIAKKMGL